jgi:hypothetical protein
MADEILEEEKVLESELAELEEKKLELAEKFESLAGVDCDFGECIFDPEMAEVQQKISEVQRQKKVIQGLIDHLEGEK